MDAKTANPDLNIDFWVQIRWILFEHTCSIRILKDFFLAFFVLLYWSLHRKYITNDTGIGFAYIGVCIF